MKKWILNFIAVGILLVGLGWLLSPLFYSVSSNISAKEEIAAFEQVLAREGMTESGAGDSRIYPELYQAMTLYNEQIYQDKQADLTDAWSYEQSPVELAELWEPDTAIGCISIPSMEVELPLYLGASTAHLALGAAVMTETSMPIGGENTNCVIAAHRGYKGAAFFREIEQIQVGDPVYVTNPWETLAYQVSAIEVTYPSDLDSILIQEGRDMLTLVTCHPYRSQGKYRYVVYCDRVDSAKTGAATDGGAGKLQAENGTVQVASREIVFEPSGGEIRAEKWLRGGTLAAISAGAAAFAAARIIRHRHKNKKKPL